MRKYILAANWKMNKNLSEVQNYCKTLSEKLGKDSTKATVVVYPPFTHLSLAIQSLKGSGIQTGAQNCGPQNDGAFTGEISPLVLKELGCESVLVGHSERRHVFKEDNALVQKRAKAALEAGLKVCFCVGETLQERKSERTWKVIEEQLQGLDKKLPTPDRFSVAYEPVWAIGTGETATPDQAEEVHVQIRSWFSKQYSPDFGQNLTVLYGGSVKPENAQELMAQKNIDGLLVGGASLDASKFAELVRNSLKSIALKAEKNK